MTASLSIGDFSRATHLTVKTLRHYHEIGLLVPADVDPGTGYRRYGTDQLAGAQVIRRLRELDMPLEQIRAVLTAPDVQARNERLSAHLARLERDLDRTARAIRSLGDLLTGDPGLVQLNVELRSVPAVTAAAIDEVVAAQDAVAWLQGALGELHATLAAQHLPTAGPAGGIYDDAIFTEHRGRATVFVPCTGSLRPMGRVHAQRIPAGEFAVLRHDGPPAEVDRTYAALAEYVARHTVAVEGSIREYYLLGQRDTADSTQWRTEVAWPVFIIAPAQAATAENRRATP
jgi:DNA-binding transcriptional MerR regulator